MTRITTRTSRNSALIREQPVPGDPQGRDRDEDLYGLCRLSRVEEGPGAPEDPGVMGGEHEHAPWVTAPGSCSRCVRWTGPRRPRTSRTCSRTRNSTNGSYPRKRSRKKACNTKCRGRSRSGYWKSHLRRGTGWPCERLVVRRGFWIRWRGTKVEEMTARFAIPRAWQSPRTGAAARESKRGAS